MWLFRKAVLEPLLAAVTPRPSRPTRAVPAGSSRSEERCREIVTRLLRPYRVEKVRPTWLRNPRTGRCLELDMFCPDYPSGPVAVEYNGCQHYVLTELHRHRSDLTAQKARDRVKRQLCRQHGVRLIVVPYTKRFEMEAYLRQELARIGVVVQ